MARMTDQELIDLRARAIQAMGSGATLGNATNYILELIEEVQELRKPVITQVESASSSKGTLIVGEMEVRKAVPAPEPVKAEETVKAEPEAPVEEAPAPAPTPAPTENWTKKSGRKGKN